MRLDARNGDYGWQVYHAEWMHEVPCVLWVDDCIPAFCFWHNPFPFTEPVILKAKKINIYPDRKLVIINPIPDDTCAADSRYGKSIPYVKGVDVFKTTKTLSLKTPTKMPENYDTYS